jgi:hypothetical protein
VFDSIEAFFFDGGDELSILDKCGGGIAVVRIDSEDVHILKKFRDSDSI